MSQSLINNVSKLKSLVLSGTIGATGPIGPQGERGNALDVNYFGELSNIKVTEIQSDTTITESNAFIIVVQSDTRTSSLNGIDTEGNLTDLTNHIVVFNGTNWYDHGLFTSVAGPQGVQGVKGVKGDTGDTGIGIQGPQGQQGVAGPQGDIGPQGIQGNQGNVGSRGESFQVDDFGDLTNVKVADIINNSGASAIDFYVFVVKVDGSISSPSTRTVALDGIDTIGNLKDLSRHTIMFDGTNWSDYGEFTGVKGDTGPTGPQGAVGGVASFQLTTNGNHVHTIQLSELEANNLISGSVTQYNKYSSTIHSHRHIVNITYVDNEFVLNINNNHNHGYLMINRGPTGPQGIQGIQGVTGPQGHQGNQGAKGDTGNIGPQGPMGAEGIQGVQGPTGPAGAVGQQGLQGVPGQQGLQGQQGDQGLKGDTGDTGPQGVAGPRGIQGLKGDQGDVGSVGPAGIQGPQGNEGPVGPQGLQGNQGIQGTQGIQGEKGDKGDRGQSLDINFSGDIDNTKITEVINDSSVTEANAYLILVSNDNRTNHIEGIDTAGNLVDLASHVIMYNGTTWTDIGSITGVKGEQGDVGPTGPQGLQGLQGDMGPQGIQGEQGTIGPQGEIGPTGPQGLQGNVGLIGPTGQQGAQGVQGPIGLTGPTGAQGPQGVKGEQGLQGIQGPQGPQGNEGGRGPMGLQGIQGVQGYTGPVGPTGPLGPLGPLGPTGVTGPIGPRGEGLKIDLQNDINDIVINNIQAMSGLSEINPYIVLVSIDNRTQGLFGIDTTGSLLNLSAKLISYNGTKWTNLGNLTGVKGDTGDQGIQGIQGDQGPIGNTGPQGERGEKGEVFQIDAYGALDDSRVTQILGTGANQSDVYVFSVSTDTRTVSLPGIDTTENLTDLSTHAIMYNGVNWTDYGQFKGDVGPIGPQGAQGIQGPRGESFQVDAFGELNDARVDTIVATSASATDFYVFVVTTDTRTSTKNLSGIDTSGNLTSLDKHVIMYDGATWSDYGQFTGLKGDKGDQGDVGPQGAQGLQGIQGVPGAQGLQGTAGGIEHSIDIQNIGGNKYVWNNNTSNPQQIITLVRGFTYYINLDVSGHPFHIQTTGNGYNASNSYVLHSSYKTNSLRHSEGDVDTNAQGKINGTITFQVPHLAPDTLYYQCEYHSGMYGEFQVTDGKGDQGIQGIQGIQGVIGPTGPSVWTETSTELSTTKDVSVTGDVSTTTLETSGQFTLGGHIIPTSNANYDLGNAEYKIRHLFLSDNSLWLGDSHKMDITGGKIKFRKRRNDIVPQSILDADNLRGKDPSVSQTEALAFAGKSSLNEMKIEDWIAYMHSIPGHETDDISNIFGLNEYEEDTTSTNKADSIVQRDESGNFAANIITASDINSTVNGVNVSELNSDVVKKAGDQTITGVKTFSNTIVGNSATATKLASSVNIAGQAFDGSSSINISATDISDITNVGSGAIITSSERTKLSNIETLADVTDSTNVLAAGAVMTSGDQTIAGVKTFSNDVKLDSNLTVSGTTTTINSTTLTVQDKNIELGTGVADDGAVNGGGIILKGTTDKSITWDNTNSAWRSNQKFTFASNVGIGTTNPSGLLELSDNSSNTYLQITNTNADTSDKSIRIRFNKEDNTFCGSVGYLNDIMTLRSAGAQDIQFTNQTNGALVTFKGDGNVGIGTTNPSVSLEVSSDITPQFLVKTASEYGKDTNIEIRGARNGTTSGEQASITLSNYDNSTGMEATHILGKISGRVSNHTTNVGDLILQTSSDGTSYTDTMVLTGAGNVGIGTNNPDQILEINGWISRTAHNNGGLCGSHNNIENNGSKTNPIYVIGNNYKPNESELINMYGIGYTSTSASFITQGSGSSSWGQYVAADGDARIWLGASAGANSYFNAGGNFGIGTDDPGQKLDVNGNAHLAGALSMSHKTGSATYNGDTTQGNSQGWHPEYDFLTFKGSGDSGDINGISFGMSIQGNHHYSPEGVVNFKLNNGNQGESNSWGGIPDKTVMTLVGSGNVGIGTDSPSEKLEVIGNIKALNSDGTYGRLSNNGISISRALCYLTPVTDRSGTNENGGNGQILDIGAPFNGGSKWDKVQIACNTFEICTGGTGTEAQSATLHVNNDGNVGIGVTSPAAKLDVNGNSIINGRLDVNAICDNSTASAGVNHVKFKNTEMIDSNYLGLDTAQEGTLAYDANYNVQNEAGSADLNSETYLDTDRVISGYDNTENTGGMMFRDKDGWTMIPSSRTLKYLHTRLCSLGVGITPPGTEGELLVNGNVGIGTSNPDYKLHIEGSFANNDNCNIKIKNTASNNFMYIQKNDDGKCYILNSSSENLYIGTENNYSDQLVLKAGGNVGIGTDSPNFKLEVASTDDTILGIRGGSNDTQKNAEIRLLEGNLDYGFSLQYHGSDTNSFKIMTRIDGVVTSALTIDRASRNVGIGVTNPGVKLDVSGAIRATGDITGFYSSDKRLKNNLENISEPIEKIKRINGYTFDWIPKEDVHINEGHDVGVVAQEVEEILPEVCTTRDNGYKAVKYEKLTPLLIECIKKQQEQIENLQEQINMLSNK